MNRNTLNKLLKTTNNAKNRNGYKMLVSQIFRSAEHKPRVANKRMLALQVTHNKLRKATHRTQKRQKVFIDWPGNQR